MSTACPKCGGVMEAAQVDSYRVRLCRVCKGLFLAHADLIAILESSWRAVAREFAEKQEFHAPEGWQNEPALRCLDCGQAMEKYGCMGIGAIQIDRCDLCALVWLDAEELQNMLVALARDEYRSEQARRRESAGRIELAHAGIPAGAGAGRLWLFDDQPAAGAEVVMTLLGLLLR